MIAVDGNTVGDDEVFILASLVACHAGGILRVLHAGEAVLITSQDRPVCRDITERAGVRTIVKLWRCPCRRLGSV
jgi:hypothetical protein